MKAGIIGAGIISEAHIRALQAQSEIAICGIADVNPEALEKRGKQFNLPTYASHIELIEKAKPDYIVVCTPHYSHADITIDAAQRGVHVLCEKPLTVSARRGRDMVEAAKKHGILLQVNYMKRKNLLFAKFHEMMKAGFVGTIQRVTLVRTEWFRTMAYYRSSPWRASWEREGGGIVVNQSPHDLDMLAWTVGVPSEVYAEMNTAAHAIEVEDDVVALMKWPNGATGTMHVTTRDWPGRDILEVAGNRGTLTIEGNVLRARTVEDTLEFSKASPALFVGPPVQEARAWEWPRQADAFLQMNVDLANAIRGKSPLTCSGEEALAEVEFANALLVSGVKGRWVHLPCDPDEYEEILKKLIELKDLAAGKQFFRSRK